MIDVPARVVAHGRADRTRHLVEIQQQPQRRAAEQLRVALERRVQRAHVAAVMRLMVQAQRALVDHRRQRAIVVRQRRKQVGL
jgi:hypothetical protein